MRRGAKNEDLKWLDLLCKCVEMCGGDWYWLFGKLLGKNGAVNFCVVMVKRHGISNALLLRSGSSVNILWPRDNNGYIYIYMRPGVSLNWLHHQNGSFSEMELVGPQFSETHLLVTGLTTSCPWSFWLCASFYNTPAPMLMAMAPHRLRLPSLPETLRWARSLRQLKRVYQRISTMTSPFFRTIWVPAPPSSAWGKIAGLNMG